MVHFTSMDTALAQRTKNHEWSRFTIYQGTEFREATFLAETQRCLRGHL